MKRYKYDLCRVLPSMLDIFTYHSPSPHPPPSIITPPHHHHNAHPNPRLRRRHRRHSRFCLAAALKNDYDCIVLARTPDKLSASMTATGVSQEVQDRYLTIITGDIRDLEAVKRALVLKERVVDTVVCGIGGTSTSSLSRKVAKRCWRRS